MDVIRQIDRWLIEEVLPHERLLRERATHLCGDRDAAEDLVQEVLMRMVSIEAWSAIADPKAYMLRMIRNLAFDRLRRLKIVDFRNIVDLEDFDIADDTPDQHRVLADRQALDDLVEALRHLPERCRTVFVQCRLEGRSPKSVAEDLGLSLSTLEKRLARAIHLLAQALEPAANDRDERSGRTAWQKPSGARRIL